MTQELLQNVFVHEAYCQNWRSIEKKNNKPNRTTLSYIYSSFIFSYAFAKQKKRNQNKTEPSPTKQW